MTLLVNIILIPQMETGHVCGNGDAVIGPERQDLDQVRGALGIGVVDG